MTLADEVLTEMKRNSKNPDFIHVSDDVTALCAVLERKGIRPFNEKQPWQRQDDG